jgi:hypothetical protein
MQAGGMRDYFASPGPGTALRQRARGESLGNVGRALLITAAVILAVGGLAVAGFMVLLVIGLNSWASNK